SAGAGIQPRAPPAGDRAPAPRARAQAGGRRPDARRRAARPELPPIPLSREEIRAEGGGGPMMRLAAAACAVAGTAALAPAVGTLAQPRAGQAMERYLQAPDAAAAEVAAEAVAQSGITIAQAVARLKAGR